MHAIDSKNFQAVSILTIHYKGKNQLIHLIIPVIRHPMPHGLD